MRHKLKGNGSSSSWRDGPPKTPTTTTKKTSKRRNHNANSQQPTGSERVTVDKKKEKKKEKATALPHFSSSSHREKSAVCICYLPASNSNRDSDYALSTVNNVRHCAHCTEQSSTTATPLGNWVQEIEHTHWQLHGARERACLCVCVRAKRVCRREQQQQRNRRQLNEKLHPLIVRVLSARASVARRQNKKNNKKKKRENIIVCQNVCCNANRQRWLPVGFPSQDASEVWVHLQVLPAAFHQAIQSDDTRAHAQIPRDNIFLWGLRQIFQATW